MTDTANARYAPPRAEVRDTVEGRELPALWNPNAAANWSLLFTPVFGAILHMKNWQVLGEPTRAAGSKRWAIVTAVLIVVLSVVDGILDTRGADALVRVAGFALLVAWYFSSARPQAAFVKARYGKTYLRRGWARPIGWAVLAYLAFFAAAVLVGVVIGMLS